MASSRSLSDAATGARSSISNDDDVELRLPPGTLRRRARSRQHIDSPAQGADQSKTLPKPTTIIPFSRDANFIEREDAFERINQACAVPSSWTALVGLGGVGKSQLAIEFAYRTREKSPENWVFWVHSSNAARFEQSYRNIAATIKIAGFQNPDANIYQLVHEWLCDESNGKWTMILDNVDDADFLIAAPNPGDGKNSIRVPLVSFLPHSQNGSILITSRSRNAALNLVDQDEIIMLEPMNQSEAVALLERKLGQQGESEAVELAAALDFMPLAIAQAAAYISQRRPRYSVKQYLLDFQASDHTRTSLLDRGNEGGQLRRDWEAKNSIMTTWQISFDHIRRIQSTAADLLAIMSFYDRQGIPDYLLQKSTYQERHDDLNGADQDTDPAQANLQFEDDVKILRDYSFICISPDGATFEMHRLVQLAMLKWLRQSGQLEKWKQRYIRSLRAEFPIGWYENWAQCQVLFPHIKLAATLPPPEEKSALQDFASLLYEAAWYAYQRGDASEAIKMSKQVMEIRISLFGREHRETVNSMGMLGVAYALGRRWVEAESLFEQAVRWLKESYGLYHFSTLNCMTNLAATYSEQGKWDLAEEMEVEAIEASKELLGVSDLDTIFRMRGHAVTLRYQGKWDASEKLLKEALSRSKSRVNIDHPYTLTIMASLGATYECQGRWEAAEKLGAEVLEKRMKILGGSHPDTLLSMSSLASSYRSQGRWNLAENLDLEVFHSRSTSFGTGHPDTLVSMEDLTLTYKCQGRWEEAEELALKAMDLRKQNGMANQPEMLATMSMLASIYWHQGDFDAAEELLDEVLEKQTERFGVNHPNTLESMSYLASTYRSQGKLLAAEKLGLETLERRAKCYGTSHPDTLLSIHDLGLTYRKQGDWKFAGEMLQEALDGQKEIIGAHHPDTLTSMASLSFLWREQGLRREALNLMRECVRLRRGFIGDNHPDFVSSSKTLAEWEAEKSKREASTSLEDGT